MKALIFKSNSNSDDLQEILIAILHLKSLLIQNGYKGQYYDSICKLFFEVYDVILKEKNNEN